MKKIDLRKELKHLYAPSARQVEVVNAPALKFVMIDGQMEPGASPETSEDFHAAMMALYGLSYTLKFNSKLRAKNPIDYGVMALEGLWWTEAGDFDFSNKSAWCYTLMMMQPKHITPAMFRAALRQAKAKHDSPALARVRLGSFREGLCLQIMHVGPYADEPRSIARMRAFAVEHGYVYCGRHHEIYLGDPRRAKPETLKTILRQPVQKRSAAAD
jgi:hypothetical protein